MAAAQLGHRIDHCLVFEDTRAGLNAGRAAGAGWNIAIAGPSHTREQLAVHHPTHLVGALTEVTTVLGFDLRA